VVPPGPPPLAQPNRTLGQEAVVAPRRIELVQEREEVLGQTGVAVQEDEGAGWIADGGPFEVTEQRR